jgi:hypothetical protein
MHNKTIWDRVLDLAMLVAAIMLYFKTAQVMTVFAPSVVFGYTGLEVLFGQVSAMLVEGVLLALHFLPSVKKNEAAQAFKWFLFAISAFCQVIDGFVVQNSLESQPASIQFLVSWGVPLIPTLIFLGLLIIGKTDDGEVGESFMERVKRVGIKSLIPNLDEMWNGKNILPATVPADEPATPPVSPPAATPVKGYNPKKSTRMRYTKNKK